jgi:Lon protease-like protein
MSSDEHSIQVNFARPMPLFPLEGVTLLPQQVVPLHIFEPRYRQMVERALDGSGQFAMATFQGPTWKQQYHGRPPLRPAVCVGQIIEHERLPDGRFNLLLQGVCRARIVGEMPPEDDRLYRLAMLEPVGLEEEPSAIVDAFRERLSEMLGAGPLSKHTKSGPIVECLKNDRFPSPVIMELVSFLMVGDTEARYALLEEADPDRRVMLLERELGELETLVRKALAQKPEEWPKGCSWN